MENVRKIGFAFHIQTTQQEIVRVRHIHDN